jgi:hypothetical protein
MSQYFNTTASELDLHASDHVIDSGSAAYYAARFLELLQHPAVHLASGLFLVALGVAGFDLLKDMPH